MSVQDLLRRLPAVDAVLAREDVRALEGRWSRAMLTEGIRRAVQQRRQALLDGRDDRSEVRAEDVEQAMRAWLVPHLRRVLNATGVVLHTNLGRAPLSDDALEHLRHIVTSYSNLELDLDSGKRGSRSDVVRSILIECSGAEDALVVNNNAGAVYLALRSLAADRQVLVSRGELVEIGGSFRIPDVMAASGARLLEVGTTNKTHLFDYERAIGPETGLLLKVHRSNFEVVGFTEEVELSDLVDLGARHGLPVLFDMGTGTLLDDLPAPLDGIPVVKQVLASGVDLLCFSGDKALGGPQCGILLGKKNWIQRLAQDPMARALRVGKLTLAALEATLSAYRGGQPTARRLPVVEMLLSSEQELRSRAEELRDRLQAQGFTGLELVSVEGQVGGGSLPLAGLQSWAVAVPPPPEGVDALAGALRAGDPALLGRVQQELFLLDVRTLRQQELPLAVSALCGAMEVLQEKESDGGHA